MLSDTQRRVAKRRQLGLGIHRESAVLQSKTQSIPDTLVLRAQEEGENFPQGLPHPTDSYNSQIDIPSLFLTREAPDWDGVTLCTYFWVCLSYRHGLRYILSLLSPSNFLEAYSWKSEKVYPENSLDTPSNN